jgi:tRNA-splicing ligase RtcB (3'-phosphate/5'-hydroxy nucleic acid ligase)
MPIFATLTKAATPIDFWTPIHQVESQAIDQLINIANLPGVVHVKAMPDVHLGKGATVGSVIATENIVSPAAVGVDIGCGMAAVRTNLTSQSFGDGDLAALRRSIERGVPVGNGPAGEQKHASNSANTWSKTSGAVDHPQFERKQLLQLGTLGGGNHFIEICLDTEDRVWIMLHSGSRNFGKEVAEGHIRKARLICEQAHERLVDKDLAFFRAGTPEFDAYRQDVLLAQDYARLNREIMLDEVLRSVRAMFAAMEVEPAINCHHNYLAFEEHGGRKLVVTRKGAIRAAKGDLAIIPGSMGTRSYIVRGLGSPDSLQSASHGAGRRMSRAAAKRSFTLDDLAKQTAGVECRKDHGVLDEIPGAYKDIDEVMANQSDLVEIVATLKQVVCVKG